MSDARNIKCNFHIFFSCCSSIHLCIRHSHTHTARIWTQFRFAVTRVRRYKRQERVVCVMFWSRPCCRCRSKLLLFAEASAFRLGSFLKKCQILNERIHCLVVDNTRSQLTHMENAFVVFHSSFHSCECDSQYQLQTSFNFLLRIVNVDSIQMHIIVDSRAKEKTEAYASICEFFISSWNAVAMNVTWYANSSDVAAAFHCRFTVPNLAN